MRRETYLILGLWVAMLLAAFLPACWSGPSLPKLPSGARSLSPENEAAMRRFFSDDPDNEPNEYDKTAAALKTQKDELGKDEAKHSLAVSAKQIGRLSIVAVVLGGVGFIVGSFFGGYGRKGCIGAVFVGIAGFWLKYLILAHGYFISETLSWIFMAGLLLVMPVLGGWTLYQHWRRWNAGKLWDKRIGQEESPRDAAALLPISLPDKKKVDDAAQKLMESGGKILGAAEQEAANVLQKFKLRLPKVT